MSQSSDITQEIQRPGMLKTSPARMDCKRLCLIRHARADWPEGVSDIDRPLTESGQNDAAEMGRRLKKRGIRLDHILTSPAVRTRMTAERIANAIGYPIGRIDIRQALYMEGAEQILKIIRGLPASVDVACIVAHNPDTTKLASSLTGVLLDNVPTCGVAIIDFDVEKWIDIRIGEGKLVLFDDPDRPASGTAHPNRPVT